MSDTIFAVSPEVRLGKPLETIDHVGELGTALRCPLEAVWRPFGRVVACDEDNALLTALKLAFYNHLPIRLSPDAVWVTLARGFALHVNEHAEELRHRFVAHAGREKLVVERRDFLPGRENPWPQVFDAFADQLADRTGGLATLVQAEFSTTGPVERAVSRLMAMDTFKTYFEYELLCGCGIPAVTLTGTAADWQTIRERVQSFADYGLRDWVTALDPILAQFEAAKAGRPDVGFWKSMFRYHSGSGPAVLTGWATVLFPYLQDGDAGLYPNPYLTEWRDRLATDDRQHWQERWDNPQGVGLGAYPACCTSVPLKVLWGDWPVDLRLVGGLLAVTQAEQTLAVEPVCGWVVAEDGPGDPSVRNASLRQETGG